MSASECFTGPITPYCVFDALVGNDGYTHCSNGCSDWASECNS
jgi:hypothetical protein